MRFSFLAAALIITCGLLTTTALSSDQIALSIYVHEGNLNGTVLSGVRITGQDSSGSSLQGTTDSQGIAVIRGNPGAWQLSFQKDGYESLSIDYDALQTEEVAAYLEKKPSTQQVSLTISVYEGDLNGSALSGVEITGTDAAGSELEATTDSNGMAVLSGTPGSWELNLAKAGYSSIDYLSYDAVQTEEVGAYLEKAG